MNSRGGILCLVIAISLAGVGLFLLSSPASAAPAAPVDIPLKQPDGTSFFARPWGDEYLHGMETLDGYTILQDSASRYWVYAVAQNGALKSAQANGSVLVVGQDVPAGLPRHARPQSASAPRAPGITLTAPQRVPNSGSQPLVLIYIQYNDQPRSYTASEFAAQGFGANASINDFYQKASYNQLEIGAAAETQGTVNDGVVSVNLAKPHPNDTNESQTIAADGLNGANPYINFAAFDSDLDGAVSTNELHIIFIIAGYEESYCGSPCSAGPAIWAHRWNLSTALNLDGTLVGADTPDGDYGGYAMFGEIHGYGGSSNHIATIGIMVHELGHDLSWPDLYDVDGGGEGVGEWSIMGSGSWNGSTYAGDIPALPDAWLKWYQGWISPTSAAAGSSYTLDEASANADVLLLGANLNGVDWEFYEHSGTGEFWLVENRNRSGYDAELPGCGILIWHIDETRSQDNDANADNDRPLVDLEQADGLRELNTTADRGDTGDPYPGATNNTSFTPRTTPAGKYYSGAGNGLAVTLTTSSCAAAMSVDVDAYIPPEQNERSYFPVLQNIRYLSGKVTQYGVAASNIPITLRAHSSAGWITYAATLTDTTGSYFFPALPDSSTYYEYYVRYTNDSNTNGYLSAYYCDYITDPNRDNLVCNIDIGDMIAAAPIGSAVYLPYTFRWKARGVGSDSYEVDFLKYNSTYDYYDYVYWTNLLGYVSSWAMTSLPGGMYIHTSYAWTVWVYGPNGYGVPRYLYGVSFNDTSSPPLPIDGRETASLHESGARGIVLSSGDPAPGKKIPVQVR